MLTPVATTLAVPADGTEWTGLLVRLGIVVALLVLSAFFSSSETALFSLSRSQIGRMKSGKRGERLATALLVDPQRLLSTIIIGNMFVNVFLTSIVADCARLFFAGRVAYAIPVSTVLLVLFGEVTPKTLAVGKAESLSGKVSYPLTTLAVLFAPLRVFLRSAANFVLFLMGQNTFKNWPGVTREEVSAVLALGEAQGVATRQERALLDNILEVTTVDAHTIMVPRTDIHGVEDEKTVGEALVVARQYRHSRLPIYHEDLDDSWGIFSAVDVLRACDDSLMDTPLSAFRERVKTALIPLPHVPVYRAPLFPETARIDYLLDEMRERRASAALIVDEYGGTSGMLTIDDILAQIAGRSLEEADDDGMTRDGRLLIEGTTSIREFCRMTDLEFDSSSADTVSGLIMEKLGRIPRAGDTVSEDEWELEVIKMAGRRVGTLSFRLLAATGEEKAS